MIAQVLGSVEPHRNPDWLPVIFNGRQPRHIGYADSHQSADAVAILARVSATYNSLAECQGRKFWLLHG